MMTYGNLIPMQNRWITIRHIPAAIAFLLLGCTGDDALQSTTVNEPIYNMLAVQQDGREDGAWGYVIFKREKLLIQQFTIPAAGGNRRFVNREQAIQVGSLVAYKLNHAKLPGITTQELDSLGITKQHVTTKK